MEDENQLVPIEGEKEKSDIIYSSEKDFYRGVGGELRLKAEGLFKKAREKGISIEEISITTLKENQAEFPGIGIVELPTYIAKVKGRHIQSGQMILDGKQIDYFNRYQKYVADKIESKNLQRDERGRVIKEDGKAKLKKDMELFLTEWERFEIGKKLVEDKEFGLEKTITGACDRVIRKLMGENDWLYPDEVRMLDEEFDAVQNKIVKEREERKHALPSNFKKATDRQINYFKARVKNYGLDPDDITVITEVLRQIGFNATKLDDLSTGDMSKIIDSVSNVIPRVKEALTGKNFLGKLNQGDFSEAGEDIKQ